MPTTDLNLILKASADPMRLQVLRLLKRDSLAASELAQALGIKQSALSHHLKLLTQAGWVNTRREGNTLFYRRHISPDANHAQIQHSVLSCLDETHLQDEQRIQLQHIRQGRVQISAEFFEHHAAELDSVTDRIAGYKHYASAIEQTLQAVSLEQHNRAVEIGPGDGGFLPFLSQHFNEVFALDIAQPMLELAKQQAKSLQNIEFIHGDIESLLAKGLNCDFIALNMVLHHLASPAEFMAQCWQLLNQNGLLLITDLCAHQQDWVRESCGDFWLGFEPDDMLAWAQDIGFTTQEPVLLGLKNGFQVQIHLFKKTQTAQ